MKKRTAKPFYDKVCQRTEAKAARLTRAAAKNPELVDGAKKLRLSVRDRLRAKRQAAA